MAEVRCACILLKHLYSVKNLTICIALKSPLSGGFLNYNKGLEEPHLNPLEG